MEQWRCVTILRNHTGGEDECALLFVYVVSALSERCTHTALEINLRPLLFLLESASPHVQQDLSEELKVGF